MPKIETELAKVMIERADLDGLPEDHEIRTLAIDFELATRGFYGDPQTCGPGKFLSCWAKARRVWSKYAGIDLV